MGKLDRTIVAAPVPELDRRLTDLLRELRVAEHADEEARQARRRAREARAAAMGLLHRLRGGES